MLKSFDVKNIEAKQLEELVKTYQGEIAQQYLAILQEHDGDADSRAAKEFREKYSHDQEISELLQTLYIAPVHINKHDGRQYMKPSELFRDHRVHEQISKLIQMWNRGEFNVP